LLLTNSTEAYQEKRPPVFLFALKKAFSRGEWTMGGLVLVLFWLDDTKYEVTTNRLAPLVDLSMDQHHSITSTYTLVEI